MMMCTIIIFVTSFSISAANQKSYEGYKVWEVHGSNTELDSLREKLEPYGELVITEQYIKKLNAMVAPELQPIVQYMIEEKALRSKVVYQDFSEIMKVEKKYIERAKGFSWTAYYDVNKIYEYIRNVSKTYSNSARLVVAGRSYEGRQLLGLRILTDVGNKTAKPAIFIDAGLHGREWIGPATTTYLINQLLTSSDSRIRHMLNTFDWHIFPVANPDGYQFTFTSDRMWRKTRSKSSTSCFGVDPNRNWAHNWCVYGGKKDPCDYQLYCGSKPFSEVETRALSKYISGIKNLVVYVAVHANAEMLVIPYSDSTDHDGNYDDLVRIGSTALNYARKLYGSYYRGPATAAEILYRASGGSMDWVREALGTPLVYTIELRGSGFHWPPHLIHQQGDELTHMMLGLVHGATLFGYIK